MKRQKETRRIKEQSGQQAPRQSKFAAKQARSLQFAEAGQFANRAQTPQNIAATRPIQSVGHKKKKKSQMPQFGFKS